MQERRRADLLAKRQKLEEMREMRKAREASRTNARQEEASNSSPRKGMKDIDDIIDSIRSPRGSSHGSTTMPGTPTLRPGESSPSGRASRASERSDRISVGYEGRSVNGSNLPPSGRVSRGSDTGSDTLGRGKLISPSEPVPDPPETAPISSGNLTEPTPISQVPERNEPTLPPLPRKPKVEFYNREVQTSTYETVPVGPTEEEIRQRIQAEVEAARVARERELEEENNQMAKEIEDEIRDLTEEARASIFSAPEFFEFFEQSSKIMQRALNDPYDYTRDYRIGTDGTSVDSEGKRVRELCAFHDERWTKNRSITDIDWSPKYPELTAASYNKNPTAINDPDGIVAIWNMHLVDRPEFVFHSQSDVLSVSFSPFHPNLVFGGTYSGQILLWDTRAKHLPILKSPLSAAGHTYPVYAMQMVGTQNAHNLITSSTDGMVCSWLVDMLAQPQETLELVHAGHNKTNEVAITTFDFPDNETATFWVGTEEGNVYQANRYDRAGSKAGLNQHDIYKGHSGPVTGLHFHPLVGPVDFSDIFLTSSVDWTVKLWKAKSIAKPSISVNIIPPIYSFEDADDYVYDVKWHPNHPAVFGSVDGSGRFDLWNLNIDTEVPIITTSVGTGRAINKLAWDRKDGRRAALGCSDGKLYIFDVGDVGVPRESEWVDLQKTMAGILSGGAAQSGLPGEQESRSLNSSVNGR